MIAAATLGGVLSVPVMAVMMVLASRPAVMGAAVVAVFATL